ncbi:MAG TPA: WbuC family cupin fold metalloprotein [Rhodocyclaceae bacterium]|nr:WbuC family cupin fold metalloprotein [Rhodocyclaceae bacterium]
MTVLVEKSPDVFIAPGPIASIGAAEIELLKDALARSTKGRVRVNLHPDAADTLHEMFIVLSRDSYIRPHRHAGKSEAFHVVYGEVDVVIFEDDGSLREVVKLGEGMPDRAFYYRMSQPFFHTLNIRSELLVVHEITNGPFVQGGTEFAAFAPEEGAPTADVWRRELAARLEAMS